MKVLYERVAGIDVHKDMTAPRGAPQARSLVVSSGGRAWRTGDSEVVQLAELLLDELIEDRPVGKVTSRSRSCPSPSACTQPSRVPRSRRSVCAEAALPASPGGFDPQLVLAFGGGVRFGGQQRGVQVGGFAPAVGGPAQRRFVGGLALAEEQVVRLALDPLARLEAERLSAWAPPAAGRLSSLSLAWM